MDLFVAGRYRSRDGDGRIAWEILGIYDDHALAVGRCSTPRDFVGPVRLNEGLPDDSTDWPGVSWPHRLAAPGEHSCTVFCENCGECLECYGEDRCQKAEDGQHAIAPVVEG